MKTSPRHKSSAFTLIEVTLALGITAFCLVPLLGMLPIGMNMDHAAIEQTTANAIMSAVAADLRAAAPTVPSGQATATEQFAIPIPANSTLATSSPTATSLYFTVEGECAQPNAAFPDPTEGAHYLLTIQFCENAPPANETNETTSRAATFAMLEVSWPSAVPAAQAAGKVQMFVALNRN
jgi:uncharacterized protein (TIGR02598 family)